MDRAFPQFQGLLVAVIDADVPEEAEETARDLARALATDYADFQNGKPAWLLAVPHEGRAAVPLDTRAHAPDEPHHRYATASRYVVGQGDIARPVLRVGAARARCDRSRLMPKTVAIGPYD